METYYRLVDGELADVSLQLYQQHENLERELTQLHAENQALNGKFDWFRGEREKDRRVIDRLIEEKQTLEQYLAEIEGYQP